MKQKNNFFRRFPGVLSVVCLMLFLAARPTASAQQLPAPQTDSIEVSLLTCSPHEEIYSLYGHSALRWHDLRTGEDLAFNWGMFSFKKPYFVLRFVFGLTDYELGVVPFSYFLQEYKSVGSQVIEQVLNLTAAEKARLQQALGENLKEENRVYRYNYFYDNCSTRPRDIVERCIDGKIEYQPREDYSPSYRDMVHTCVRNHPWAAFGNDMLLGLRADVKTDRAEQEFLPDNLLYDFDRAQIYADGTYRPLVKERRIAMKGGVQVIEQDFPLSPTACFLILLVLSLLVMMWEWKKKHTLVVWDVVLMICQGLAGCVLFVMLFSQHPTTSTNLQLLLLNPLPFFFLPAIIRKRPTRWWTIQIVLIAGFFLGALVQHYAEGMMILALCLLLRSIMNIKNVKTKA